MNPYLTTRGKWCFAAGIGFIVLGALLREPLLLLFGQVPFAVLIIAVAILMPAARCVDRRVGRFFVDGEDQKVMTLSRRAQSSLRIWLENGANVALRVHRLRASTAGPVEVAPLDGELHVGAGEARCFELNLRPSGVGRASLQGFDMVLVDRWGLLAVHDYLPCLQVFESYPALGGRRWKSGRVYKPSTGRAVREVNRGSRSGTDLRELRDFQPGDPLRSIAWKATVRQRRLITREFDDQRNHADYIALDISSSMRAGKPRGMKFEHGIEIVAALSARGLNEGRRVGLWTFDHDIYGEVSADCGPAQRRRIQRHLVGLRSVVDASRTALDDEDLEAGLADYLLVQERLDFRSGRGLRGELDRELLRRWLRSMIATEERRWHNGSEAQGVIDDDISLARRFYRLRGIPLDPLSEVRAGAKVRGIEKVVEATVRRHRGGGRLTIVSDLCGLSDVESLQQPVAVARRRGMAVRFLVLFTPHYGRRKPPDSRRVEVVRELFTRAERKDRLQVAERLVAMGLAVRFVDTTGGDQSPTDPVGSGSGSASASAIVS